MKAYCFSDYHDEEELLPKMRRLAAAADIVISAGDHTIFEHKQASILKEFASWKKPVYLIHGNHESLESLKEACKRHKDLHVIHGEEVVIRGARLLGWGGGGFTSHDRELEKRKDEWKRSEHARLPTIMVTHAPPYKTTLDLIDDRHVGNRSIRKAIKELRPAYAVSGHIHESEGARDELGMTRCYNLGPLGKTITL